ncbi:hypothetical protein ACFL2B_03080 [Patescibacteria group bacterium]
MALGNKIGYGILQFWGAFFDKRHVPPALRYLILAGIAALILWANDWNWWVLLEVIAWVMWILFALVLFFIIQRTISDKKKYGQ